MSSIEAIAQNKIPFRFGVRTKSLAQQVTESGHSMTAAQADKVIYYDHLANSLIDLYRTKIIDKQDLDAARVRIHRLLRSMRFKPRR